MKRTVGLKETYDWFERTPRTFKRKRILLVEMELLDLLEELL